MKKSSIFLFVMLLTPFVFAQEMYGPGDANRDGSIDLSDPVYILQYLFAGGGEPCLVTTDVNGDNLINLADAVFLLQWLFQGGSAPFGTGSQDFACDALSLESHAISIEDVPSDLQSTGEIICRLPSVLGVDGQGCPRAVFAARLSDGSNYFLGCAADGIRDVVKGGNIDCLDGMDSMVIYFSLPPSGRGKFIGGKGSVYLRPGFSQEGEEGQGKGGQAELITVRGSSQNDIFDFRGTRQSYEILGGPGNDRIFGGEGNDRIVGDSEPLLWASGDFDDVIYGGGGDDILFGDDGAGAVLGTSTGDDSVYGGQGNDHIYGGLGTDRLSGEEGDDIIFGGEENSDVLIASGKKDDNFLYGGPGNDFIQGGYGDDRIYAGPQGISGEENILVGGLGYDRLVGEVGSDALFGGGGNDYLWGNPEESDGQGTNSIYIDSNLLFGGTGEDHVYGSNGNDFIFGGKEKDILFGYGGDDLVFGDTDSKDMGFDLITPSIKVKDILEKVKGSAQVKDVFAYRIPQEAIGAGDEIALGCGNDIGFGEEGDDIIDGDVFFAGIPCDKIDKDWIFGGRGKDIAEGMKDTDVVYGGEGDDTLYGDYNGVVRACSFSNAEDVLCGGPGNDELIGDCQDSPPGGSDELRSGPRLADASKKEKLHGLYDSADSDSFYDNDRLDEKDRALGESLSENTVWQKYAPDKNKFSFQGVSPFTINLPDCYHAIEVAGKPPVEPSGPGPPVPV